MRRDYPPVIWGNYSYGYEARLDPHGRAFARARMVRNEPGIHYELIWLYGPKRWRPERVRNLATIKGHLERYVAHHRARIIEQMPGDPMAVPPWLDDSIFYAPDPLSTLPEGQFEGVSDPICNRCGRLANLCRRMMSARDRRAGHGWPCSAS